MKYRQSDRFVVLKIMGIINPQERRDLHNTNFGIETLSIHRDRRNNGNENIKNSSKSKE